MAGQRRVKMWSISTGILTWGLAALFSVVPTEGHATSLELGLEGGGSLSAPAFNSGLVAIYGDESLRYFGKLDWNPWLMPQSATDRFRAGALNLAAGVEYRFLQGRVRSAISAGVSRLLFETALDEAGSMGLFFELTPLGVRWPLTDDWAIRFDPVSMSIVAPVLSGIPLILLQYRHTAAVEWSF